MTFRETIVAVLGLVGGFVKWVGVCILAMAVIWAAYSAFAFAPLLIAAYLIYKIYKSRR